jgi:flagellar basal body-associated protein FliL
MRDYKKPFYAAIVIIIILLLLMSIALFRAYRNFSVFEEHRNYFNSEEAKIEPWMNIHAITFNFNITQEQVVSYFNVSERINPEASLNRLCKQYNKNCTEIVADLNKIK